MMTVCHGRQMNILASDTQAVQNAVSVNIRFA